MSTDKPKLQCTKDYNLFEPHPFNRPLHEDKNLLRSMQEHGWMPSSPAQCIRNGNGKLKVVRGHHRLDYAKRFGLPVYYVIDESCTEIFELENPKSTWTYRDYIAARAQSGDPDMAFVQSFMNVHHLPVTAALALLGNESVGSQNKVHLVKTGGFKVTSLEHAESVVAITDLCRDLGMKWATYQTFVAAVSMVVRVPEFDGEMFMQRLRQYPSMMNKRSTADEYLEEIEALYNYRTRKPVPLAFNARKITTERNPARKRH